MEGRTTRKHTSLTGKQKKYRRDNDLCMYCGDPEHKVAECDKSPTKRRTVTDITIPKTPLSPKLIPQVCLPQNFVHTLKPFPPAIALISL